MGDRSTEKLVAALIAANAPVIFIEKAKMGSFHDFKSGSATPITDLVAECRNIGMYGIAKRAINGEFDAGKEEAKEWAATVDISKLGNFS